MLSEAVAHAARDFGDTPAVLVDGRGPTWGEVDRAATALTPMLTRRGATAGDVVALVMHSGPQWLVAATAVDRIGATIAGISAVVAAPERARMVEAVDAALVLADGDLTDGLPLRRSVAVFGPDGLDDEKPRGHPAAIPSHDRGPQRRYAVCFTSGTTGAPKAAVFPARCAAAVESIDTGGLTDPDGTAPAGFHTLASTQFAHVGFVLKVPWYARLGCTIHVMRRWRAQDAMALIDRHRISTLGVVAPQLALILASPERKDHDLSCLRLVIAGGAPSPRALIDRARTELGVAYSIRWSSTESGGVGLAALVDDGNPEASGTIGTPRPGIRARVADADGTELPSGEVGELQLDSPAMMEGYLGDPDATRDAFTPDGWLRTGDLASIREDGRFVLAGRSGDMYIRGGYNVHPEEVEAVLAEHPGVAAVAIAARPDDLMGEVGVAFVVPADPSNPPTLDSLRAHGGTDLARYKLPEAMVLLDALPLTDAAKLDRLRLGEMLER